MGDSNGSAPDFGRLAIFDRLILVYCFLRVLIWELPLFLLTYPYVYSNVSTPFFFLLQCFFIRACNELMNPACIRWITGPSSEHVEAVLSSKRYSRYRKNIYHAVSHQAGFKGFWIIQSSLETPKPALTSDLTIFYLHGGGYISSQPGHYLLFLLRLAEAILEEGISVSIFALDYSLAPEHQFPKQLEETAAAYRYLVDDEHISPEKIVVAGDSAGGHLALSFLVNLAEKRSSLINAKGSQTPRGLVLISPWLSLHNELPSMTANGHMDVLSAPFLRTTARRFVNLDAPVGKVSLRNSPYLEFLAPEPEIQWDTVLPGKVWVFGGADEILIDSITLWVELVKGKLGEGRVHFEIGKGNVHVWHSLETVMNFRMKKEFLDGEIGDGKGFEGAAKVGRLVAAQIRGR